jgi:gamma-glutamylputrescine oxidase
VAVVGGGVLGVAATYWLARRGVSVVLLEASALGCGASGRNAGFMLCGASPLEDQGLIGSVLQEEAIAADFDQPGHLALAGSREIEERIRQEISRRPASAQPLEWLDHGQCESLVGLHISRRFSGGRWFPGGRTIQPVRLVYGLAHAAVSRGASILENTTVLSLQDDDGASGRICVATSSGRVRARQVVLACNFNTGVFLPELQPAFAPLRGQVVSTSPLPRLFGVGMAVDWGTLYWRQAGDGTVVLGGYHNLDPRAEATTEIGLNPTIQSALPRFLQEAFPGFPDFEVRHRWSGIMDETIDGKPIAGRSPDGREIWVIAGCGGHGLPPALGMGKAVAESMLDGKPCSMLGAFDPARFKSGFETARSVTT